MAVRATLGASITRVVTRHVAFVPKHPLVHRLKYTKTCDGIIAVSGAVKDVLVAAGIPESHITVIHTGIQMPAAFERHPHDGLVVGHMGAFTREKGQDVLIETARRLPHIRFVLAGDGPLLEECRQSASENASFPGFVANKADFFAGIDIFVMPSRSEAWGLAAIEAMAHGVPVIASDIPGLGEIVTPGTGRLFPAGDAEALSRAIGEGFRAEPATLRARAAEFTVSKMVEETELFYERTHRLK